MNDGGGRKGKSCLTVTIIGVHVEVWNLPAVDAGICPTTVTVFTVAAHGDCQHGAPGGFKVGGNEKLNARPSPGPCRSFSTSVFRGWPTGIQLLGLLLCHPGKLPVLCLPSPHVLPPPKAVLGASCGGTAEHPGPGVCVQRAPGLNPPAAPPPVTTPCLWGQRPPYL